MRRVFMLLALPGLLLQNPLHAQERDRSIAVAPGALLRLSITPDSTILGRLWDHTPDTLILIAQSGSGLQAIPRQVIQKIEVQGKNPGAGVLGILLGGAAGFAYGIAGHPGAPHLTVNCDSDVCASEGLFFGAIFGGLLGLVLHQTSSAWYPAVLPEPLLAPVPPGEAPNPDH